MASHSAPRIQSGMSLVKIGGSLAVAGTIIGTLIFLLGCMGFGAAFTLALIPAVLGAVGLILTFLGGFFQDPIGMDDPGVLAAIVVNFAVICGGLLEVLIWLNIPFFFVGGAH